MPNDRIRIAGIGCGGRGASVLGGMSSEDIVALCDVDERRAADSFGKFPKAGRFMDFRVMLDRLADKIDAVFVATPDHTHAPAALAAIKRGKHVYCEKPLAHSIGEVRAMRKAAHEMKVITQVGNQGHSSESIRVFRELIEAGAIGDITEVHAGKNASSGSCYQLGRNPDMLAGNEKAPKELAWDLWLGPAAERPYYGGYLPGKWRGFSAFGNGTIGDWVCHVLDPVFWAADLDMPTAITAETRGWNPAKDREFFPPGVRITFEFPAKGRRPPLKILWHDGTWMIPRPAELGESSKMVATGAVIRGKDGVIMHGSHGAGGVKIVPREKHQQFVAGGMEKKHRRVKGGHQRDWLDAIREGRQAGSTFDYGGGLTEIALLGIIGMQFPGERLEWDAKGMKFTSHESANAFVSPKWRAGWMV